MSILCAEAVILEIQKHYEFDTQKHGVYWEYDLMVDIKLRNPKKSILSNPSSSNASAGYCVTYTSLCPS